MIINRHLPDVCDFEHLAVAPWPLYCKEQLDWVAAYDIVETWLNSSVGPHWVRWAWSTCEHQTSFDCCVRFRLAQDRTLFLLRWT